MKLLKTGDIVKFDNRFCKVSHPRQYDDNFNAMVELEYKGKFGCVPAHAVKWNGKQWICEVV